MDRLGGCDDGGRDFGTKHGTYVARTFGRHGGMEQANLKD